MIERVKRVERITFVAMNERTDQKKAYGNDAIGSGDRCG
jgi:hypothetical protein